MSNPAILVADDDELMRDVFDSRLPGDGWEVFTVKTPEEGLEAIEYRGPDFFKVVVSDYDFGLWSATKGDAFLRAVAGKCPDAHRIMMSGLSRDPIPGVKFFSKMSALELITYLETLREGLTGE